MIKIIKNLKIRKSKVKLKIVIIQCDLLKEIKL